MEDRCTPVLYLELGDASPPATEARARQLVRAREVERVTWWDNCLPGRTDLPARVEDGRSLVVAECHDDFATTPPPHVSAAHSFRRHARPSQGIVTGNATLGLLVVWISPRNPDLADSLRDWGDFVHLRHIAAAAVPGFTQISVYENTSGADPLFMHFYEFDRDDAETTFSTMTDHVAPRLGGYDSADYREWADLRAAGGRLFYCNTFSRCGEVTEAATRRGKGGARSEP